jgi:nucleotide-binding universal stress UspA family protein
VLRKIFVPIRADGKGALVLGHAAAIARRFDAHVSATHCRPRSEDLEPYGIQVPVYLRRQFGEQVLELARAEEAKLREEFDELAARYRLRVVDRPEGNGGSTVAWREEAGKQVDVIKRHGRLADLIVVAKPDRDRNLGANTLKSALFHTARPVLMCPPTETPPETLGEHVSIAWNGSIEATRAVAMAMDVIERASQVTILTAGREEIHGATADDLIDFLAIRGLSARLDRFTPGGRPARALLERSAAAGADLMIMGAYSDSHEREAIFGGNTQVVVDEATSPVILVH